MLPRISVAPCEHGPGGRRLLEHGPCQPSDRRHESPAHRGAAIDTPRSLVDPKWPRPSRCMKMVGAVADFTRVATPRAAAGTVDSLRLQTRKTVWRSAPRPGAGCGNPPCGEPTAGPARRGRPSGCRRSRPESDAGMACACAVSCPPVGGEGSGVCRTQRGGTLEKDLVRQRVVGEEQLAVQGESMMRTRSARECAAFSRVPRPYSIADLVA